MVRKKQKINSLVSVNLRTYNSAKTVWETLESVKKQTYKNLEIIVSDGSNQGFSNDGTIDILKKYHCKIFYADKLGDARYQNIKKSKGEYVFSLDSDQVLARTLIEKAVKKCAEEKLDALIISEKSRIRSGTYLERLIAFDKKLIDKSANTGDVFGTVSPRFFKKSILRNIKWPKNLSIFDDAILYSSLVENGYRVGYLASPSLYHHEVTNWKTLFKKFFRYGKGYLNSLRAKPMTVAVRSLPRGVYFTKFALREPKYFLGLPLLYFVKVIAASLGMVSQLFEKILKTK